MNTAKRLLHTRYRVNNLEKTVQFYRDIVGLQEVRRHKSGRGSELVFLKAPGSQEEMEICHFPQSGPVQVQPDLTHVAFEVDSLEEFGKHLVSKGAKYSDGPTCAPTAAALPLSTRPKAMRSSSSRWRRQEQGIDRDLTRPAV